MKKNIILVSLLALSVGFASAQNNKIVTDVATAASSNQAVFVQEESTKMSRRDSMKQSLNAISDKILDQLDADNADYVLNHLDLLILLKRRNERGADGSRFP